jgi:hypothetical protein
VLHFDQACFDDEIQNAIFFSNSSKVNGCYTTHIHVRVLADFFNWRNEKLYFELHIVLLRQQQAQARRDLSP